MPPRKSLSAAPSTVHRPTPKRGQSSTPRAIHNQSETAPRKRLRRTEIEDDLESIEAEPEPPVTRQANGIKAGSDTAAAVNGVMDPEKELEHWQDFAVEHYEMVEQLPLELHRNYRLLRELDDGVAGKCPLEQETCLTCSARWEASRSNTQLHYLSPG
jgi:hypothetical protein